MNATTETINLKNPFPGLRPFNETESHLYFGRDKQVKEVLDKLITNHFVAIIGTSGIGKSSFIYCGLFPQLRDNQHIHNDVNFQNHDWEIFRLRPGSSPIKNLSQAIDTQKGESQESSFFTDVQVDYVQQEENILIQSIKNKSEANSLSPKNYLVFVDQFEEIFNPQNNPEESAQFISTLEEAANQKTYPIFVVITMRSDFIGNCSQYPKFTELINESQFLIPYMTREEKREAIVMPIHKSDVQIEEDLVDMILDDVGNTLDQLPLMQHALMRTWDVWERSSDEMILKHHYQQIGRIQNALSKHADEAFNELNPDQKNICAKVFKAITFKKVRRPTPLGEIAAIANAPVHEVKEVIEHFRREDCGLLMPPPDIFLDEYKIIDISHESLISNWTTLKTWVEEEDESIKNYLRLSEAAEMHQEGKVSLWRPPQLTLAINWWKDQDPTVAWAERHHSAFEYERAKQFLDASQRAYEKNLENEDKLKKKKIRQANIIAVIFFMGAIVAGIFGIYAYYESIEAEKAAERANREKERAEANFIRAEDEKKRAEDEKKRAEQREKEAKEARKISEEKEREAERQKNIALLAREAALIAQKDALEKKKAAEAASKRAETQKRIAEIERSLAEIAEQKAEKLRYLSLAKTMAIKSTQIEDSTMQKALLAKQAFDFNWEYGGDLNDPDIYAGLYYAIKKAFKDEGKQYSQLDGHAAKIRAFAPYSEDLVFSAGDDGRIILLDSDWQISGQPEVSSIRQIDKIHRALALSPDKSILACGGYYSEIQLLNPSNLNDEITNIPATNSRIWYLEFLSDRLLISADESGRIAIWDVQSQQLVSSVKKEAEKIHDITVKDDMVYVAYDNQIIQVNAEPLTPNILYTDPSGSPFYSLSMSSKGMLAAGSLNGTITLFDTKQGFLKMGALKGHKGLVNSLVFNANADQLASGSFDGTVRIWDLSLKNGLIRGIDELPIILRDHILENQKQQTHYVWSISFSPNGHKLLAGCSNSLVRSWPTRVLEMANLICPKLDRNFSKKEWERFIASTQEIFYRKTCANYADGRDITPDDKEKNKKDNTTTEKKLGQPSN